MKRKAITFILVAVMSVVLVMSVVACNSNNNNNNNSGGKKNTSVAITVLPDMVDYGADSNYYKDGTTTYSESKKTEWTKKLDEKRDSERENWYDASETTVWDNAAYYTFGPKAQAYGENEEKWQSNIGYFNANGTWVDDESANTIERLFCYSTSEDFIRRMSEARLDEDKMDALVEYICREDDDREKGDGYTYVKGTSSAIEDYNQLDELYNIYDDFSAYEADSSYKAHIFKSEDDVSDAISRKKRKIFGEVIDIYGDKADQFARSAIELVSYGIEIFQDTMIPVYNKAKGNNVSFEDYMRNEVYDYETLSYLLTFKDRTSFDDDDCKATNKKNMMSLYGYYYQYEKTEYAVFDDSVMVGNITEYEDYLKLSHNSYFNSTEDALRNRNYDRRIYEKSYRYSYACYQKYYGAQLGFQKVQEETDLEVYKGGAVAEADMGSSETKGQYKTGLSVVNSSTSYSQEMQRGCDTGLESTLKLTDVNWEYTGVDKNVLQYNTASKNWNSLSDSEQELIKNKIKEVKLELEQLKSQDYTINHASVSEADLTKALQYEIYSYSADSIRNIQACKKDEVIYYKDIDRFLSVNNTNTYSEIMTSQAVDIYVRTALESLVEDAGRNDAKYANLIANFSYAGISDQVNTAATSDWKGIKSNIKTTLAEDFEAYTKANPTKDVSEYFEDTLIRKKWSCGAELTSDECKNGDGHANCTKDYDTSWALSRLLNNHEKVIRYSAGQYVVTFKSIDKTKIADEKFFVSDVAMTSREAIVAGVYDTKTVSYGNGSEKTLSYNDEIGSVCRDTDKNGNYYDVNTYSNQYWKNMPSYSSSSFTVDNSGNITVTKGGTTYIYRFIGWFVDENFKYRVNLDEAYNYDVRLYPAYKVEKVSG